MTSLLLGNKLITLFIILALLVGAVLLRAHQREARWEERYPPAGDFIDVGGVRVHYEQMGSGRDVVLVHGASGNTRDMALTLAPVLAKNFRVTLFDRPGLGYTDRLPAADGGPFDVTTESPTEQAELLRNATQALGIEAPIVVGHSFGGAVALAWASAFPDDLSGLVDLAGAVYPWGGDVDWTYDLIGNPIGHALVPPIIAGLVPESYMRSVTAGVFDPQPMPEGYYDAIGVPLVTRRHSMRANATQVKFLDAHLGEQSALYPRITVPVEILHGDADDTVGLEIHSERLAQTLPDARLTVLQGVGHMLHHSHADEIAEAVARVAALNSD